MTFVYILCAIFSFFAGREVWRAAKDIAARYDDRYDDRDGDFRDG
jgi:hypothetical protein